MKSNNIRIKDELAEEVRSIFVCDSTDEEMFSKFRLLITANPGDDELAQYIADSLLTCMTHGVYKYGAGELEIYKSLQIFREYSRCIRLLNKPNHFHTALIAFFDGDNIAALDELLFYIREKNVYVDCAELLYVYVIPLKNGFRGMWTALGNAFKEMKTELGIPEMCYALESLYYLKLNEEIIDTLSEVVILNNSMYLAIELLGNKYYECKMWRNAIACFQQLEEIDYFRFFPLDMEYHWTAWAYGKVKDYKNEEYYYRKELAVYPDAEYALNNLGYCLFTQKKYIEAKDIFIRCLSEKRDEKYARNNLIRVMLAMGDIVEAKEFLRQNPKSIVKELRRRTEEAKVKDRQKNIIVETGDAEQDIDESEYIRDDRLIDLGVQKQQFTSEKILEDELILRLEKGYPVFGHKLSVYEKPRVYGRQYIIPVGRIDILAQDNDGNLYAIELKRNSGYSDPFEQTVRYVEWLRKNLVAPDKKVYGIICMNSPSSELIMKVRCDLDIQLYEYSISYTEIK